MKTITIKIALLLAGVVFPGMALAIQPTEDEIKRAFQTFNLQKTTNEEQAFVNAYWNAFRNAEHKTREAICGEMMDRLSTEGALRQEITQLGQTIAQFRSDLTQASSKTLETAGFAQGIATQLGTLEGTLKSLIASQVDNKISNFNIIIANLQGQLEGIKTTPHLQAYIEHKFGNTKFGVGAKNIPLNYQTAGLSATVGIAATTYGTAINYAPQCVATTVAQTAVNPSAAKWIGTGLVVGGALIAGYSWLNSSPGSITDKAKAIASVVHNHKGKVGGTLATIGLAGAAYWYLTKTNTATTI